MPGEILDTNTVMLCTHGGKVTPVPSQVRVKTMGAPVLTMNDTGVIAGCAFTVGSKPSPCIKIMTPWIAASTRVRVGGQFVVVRSSQGLGVSPEQAPQGPVTIVAVQPRVKAM